MSRAVIHNSVPGSICARVSGRPKYQHDWAGQDSGDGEPRKSQTDVRYLLPPAAEEIESAFIGWRSPASIADEWACRPGEVVKDIVLPVRARVSVQIGTGKSSLARRGSGEQCEKAIHE